MQCAMTGDIGAVPSLCQCSALSNMLAPTEQAPLRFITNTYHVGEVQLRVKNNANVSAPLAIWSGSTVRQCVKLKVSAAADTTVFRGRSVLVTASI
jgi:hypothetical protein